MLIKTGLAVSQMSGTMGGVVASHNRGGAYFRKWSVPTDPKTSRQLAFRGKMGLAAQVWSTILTDAQRAAWNLYAANTAWTNRLGESVYLTGMQMFIRYNVPVAFAQEEGSSASLVLTGPAEFGLATAPVAGTVTISAATGLSFAFSNTEEWAKEAGGVLLIHMGTPRGAAREYFSGPYRFAAFVDGDNAVPPTSPKTVAAASLPFPVAVGQKVRLRAYVARADGRLSNDTFVDVTVGA